MNCKDQIKVTDDLMRLHGIEITAMLISWMGDWSSRSTAS